MTLFAYALPLPHLLRVWDLVLVEGWKALFKVAIAKLQVKWWLRIKRLYI